LGWISNVQGRAKHSNGFATIRYGCMVGYTINTFCQATDNDCAVLNQCLSNTGGIALTLGTHSPGAYYTDPQSGVE
jgi:hypothetical protein